MVASKYTVVLFLLAISFTSFSQTASVKDSVVYRITFRDTVIYRYDTVHIRTYVQSDTIRQNDLQSGQKRKLFLPNNWGIGPSLGAYYSPFHGFDVNLGFGVQYYLFAVPGFRNPHMGRKKGKR